MECSRCKTKILAPETVQDGETVRITVPLPSLGIAEDCDEEIARKITDG